MNQNPGWLNWSFCWAVQLKSCVENKVLAFNLATKGKSSFTFRF